MIDNNKIVISRKDIQGYIIAGESPIYAKKKAKEAKLKALQRKMWAMDNETLKVLESVFIEKKDIQQSDNVSSILSYLNY